MTARLLGRRVLLVEDEFLLADALAASLEELGAEVLGPFASAADALAALERCGAPDCAVLDVRVLDGFVWPVAAALAARGVPFVLATGCGGAGMPPEFSAVPLFAKPVEAGELAAALFGTARAAADHTPPSRRF